MPDLTIKDLDDSTLRTIAFQAEVQNRSVDEVAIGLIRLGLLHDVEGRVAVADRIRSGTRGPVEDSTDVIRRMRDAV
ncbi:hypothetical protein [Methylobacterium sp. J-090]|uniref:hypothetical protein n=1 Tax=Methylobacterium sp. J-090 TaxID=2836666 RepID=UPI001FBBE082|nr:hypothetical protein [Methylobacterium sp. J-090]MCJ2082940.1 hypothetical protein [Methylobacterium sp. J-090]